MSEHLSFAADCSVMSLVKAQSVEPKNHEVTADEVGERRTLTSLKV